MNKDLEQFYDTYAPIMYGCITRLVADKQIAEAILADAFLKLSADVPLVHAAKSNIFYLLRFSSCFTLQKLKELDLQPLPGKSSSERLLIDWLCCDCDSIDSLVSTTGLSRREIREQLRAQSIALRVEQASAKSNLTFPASG